MSVKDVLLSVLPTLNVKVIQQNENTTLAFVGIKRKFTDDKKGSRELTYLPYKTLILSMKMQLTYPSNYMEFAC